MSHSFRHTIDDATKATFAGRKSLCTTSGEIVLLKDVLSCNCKAEKPLASALEKITNIGHSDVVKLIRELYPRLLPYFIDCGTRNPVHHTAYVLEFLAKIIISEKRQREIDVKVVMLAALFHDVALGLSRLPKITESHVKDKTWELVKNKITLNEFIKYNKSAVQARKEHTKNGAQIADEMLNAYNRKVPTAVSENEIIEIKRIIYHHDDPKIPLLYHVIRQMFEVEKQCRRWSAQLDEKQKNKLQLTLTETGENYLISINDWLLQYHHEADLLWMLTSEGIEADLARFHPSEKKTAEVIITNNISLHRQESELYRDLANFNEFGFRNGTVYRSKTGYLLFERLLQTP